MMPAAIQVRCERTTSEAGDVKVFTLKAQSAHDDFLKTIQPGRHIAIKYPDTVGVLQQRLYSITRKQEPNVFEIAVKRSGRKGVSDHLHSTLQEGSLIPLQYVAGDISLASIIEYDSVGMVAGGIGITLPIALIRELASLARQDQKVPRVSLLLCVPKIADIPFLHELLELELTTSWFTFYAFITRERVKPSEHFKPGRPTIDALHFLGKPQAVVICGSHTFAHDFREGIATTFPESELLIESFTPPASIESAVVPEANANTPITIRVSESNKVIESSPGKSLLDILEANSVKVKSQCRSGICGNCRVKVSNGNLRREPDFCLSKEDKNNGYALACCTFPLSGHITVDL